ncbi:MAG: hypothetical protein JWN70_5191 [Planctomycetaceae bacterium]|nr:hypothetical protein [Planctomycetaceae bacterium]
MPSIHKRPEANTLGTCVIALFVLASPFAIFAAEPPAPAKGLGDPGQLRALKIDTARTINGQFTLQGKDARQQLAVTGEFVTGQERDLTRTVQYDVAPAGLIQIDATGFVVPLADGQGTITARSSTGLTASTQFVVAQYVAQPLLHFDNQIMPILTKFGCNSGNCHGKAGGQGGFALSLLGFDPLEDFERLVKEERGRRVFAASPEKSLLLRKPAGVVPHGGGIRLPRDSHSYEVLRRWIAQGLPYDTPEAPRVARIEVFPRERILSQNGEQQMLVVAHYSDGTHEDVTSLSQFEPNNKDLAKVSSSGLVTTLDQTGGVAIMARYHGEVAVFQASIPLGAPIDAVPSPRNFIDELVFKRLKILGLPPSKVCDDATFLRRTSIDIAGRLPIPSDAEQFLADTDSNKRDKWIDKLLASTDYADYFARKWILLLRSKRVSTSDARGTMTMHDWVREALYSNQPYDQIVRDILCASGDIEQHPPVNWWRQVKDTSDQVENTAQVFLGLRIQCARCHHHPFDRWSQQDYYGFAAFFSRVGRKYDKGYQANVERIYHDRGVASAKHPRTGAAVPPTGLGGQPIQLTPDDDPREALVDWMTEKDNPFFAPALVNRYWKHFFGRGLVDPEDDMRLTNPASNPELLDALAKHFITSGFDLKDLVRTICRSQVYQLSAESNDYNLADKQNYARFYPRRMMAEVLLDSIDDVTLSRSNLGGAPGLPSETRAVQLPHDPYPYQYFLQIFGMPEGATACECERVDSPNLGQNLHLMNSAEIQGKVSSPVGRAAVLSADTVRTPEQKVREIFLFVYSRPPKAHELELALKHLGKAKDKQAEKSAIEDILWALINTKEFMYNH